MKKFHYDYIKNKYSNKPTLLFIDTDCLINEIEIENVYDDFSKNKKIFDFSSYSVNSKYYDDSKA